MDPDSLRVTRLGLFANIGIGFVKVIGGWKFRSQALTADGYHSVGDSFVDLIALMSIFLSSYFKFSTSPSSKGHSISRTLSNSKKIESIGSIIIGFMILTGGVSFAWESSKDLYENDLFRSRVQTNNAGEDSLASSIPSFYAAWLAVGSILVKEFIYAITMKVARRNHSLILAANASHHRMDSLTTMLAIFATVAAHIFPKMLIVDPVCGLLVAVFVIKCGADAILGGVAEIRNPSDPIADGKED